ncbi:MAG: AmmeMemoRadiSam system protein A [Candidatus Aerophobetes bacterium]|nr:AmmeMemoRadiSam system protein A [Candidatus Aerophobetes bacterium]
MDEEKFPSRLGREAIRVYLREKREISPPAEFPEEFRKRAGVFVSLHKKGRLRGCIGTFLPAEKNTVCEIIKNAISAATRDPRFPPMREDELNDVEISVDVLSKPERVHSEKDLDPKKYGVIVNKGWQKGLLLPDLEGVDTVEQQIEIAKQKAGLWKIPAKELEIQRFTVTRYEE